MDALLRQLKKIIPKKLFKKLQPFYHYALAFLAAFLYRFPSQDLKVVGITGTKGKTSTAELVSAILEAAGHKTALAGTLRFKIGDETKPNLFKMTMPGRFFMQRFLRRAADAKCDWAVLELTSEGAKQSRHAFIELDALVFTNLAPEHIESHGSYEAYRDAKLRLARALEKSTKPNRAIVANADDKEGEKFLAVHGVRKFPFRLREIGGHKLTDSGVELVFKGEHVHSPLPGLFNVYNIMAAATFADSQEISSDIIKKGVEGVLIIKGRAEEIRAGQKFTVVVDYAHTPDSLRAVYEAYEGKKKICVLGNTGGGRDAWKRPEMGRIADECCSRVILTDEDPYDEDPKKIVQEMASGMHKQKPEIIMDRRAAIARALLLAQQFQKQHKEKTAVLITGKGTDPYIMGPNGSKLAWSDASVAREEISKLRVH